MLTELFLKIAYAGAEWILWILVAASIISLATIVERFMFFYRQRVDIESLSKQLSEHLRAGNLRGAWDLVSTQKAVECFVVTAGLWALKRGPRACGESMLSAKAKARKSLEAGLVVLGTIGSTSPFVGLLGTVLGIIHAAHDLAESGASNPGAVMTGVFEALVATAVGLFVAIPAVIAFNAFQRKVRATLSQVDALAHLVLANAPVAPSESAPAPSVARMVT